METLEALRIYSSTAYKDDIESLTVLFTKLEQPVVKEIEEPAKVKVASVKCGSTLSTVTSNINTGTDHSICTPKIVSYADAVRTG